MGNRRYVFNPGPAALPLEVLEQAREELVEYGDSGMSLMEMSHRSRKVEELNDETQRLLLELMGLEGENGFSVVFMGGGASAQFALIPMNFLAPGKIAHYVLTGSFAQKAHSEAAYIGDARVAASGKESGWRTLPDLREIPLEDGAAYLHLTTNNTIEGSRYDAAAIPGRTGAPLIADMTSDLLGRTLDYGQFDLLYAGAQKNLGPAGVTVVVVKNELLKRSSTGIPLIMRYATFVKERSLYNTPPVHAIYMMNLMLKWTKAQGGVPVMERRNAEKAAMLYGVIDGSGGFYRGIVEKRFRSHMNVTWRMADPELERRFIRESEDNGFEGLAGHRSVGGLRASIYNGVPAEACGAIAAFMNDFLRRNG